MYFVAQTGALLAGERLYVDSCYATTSKDPNGVPKVNIIKNYGCVSSKKKVTFFFFNSNLICHFTCLDFCLCSDFSLQLHDRQQEGGQQLPVPFGRGQCA